MLDSGLKILSDCTSVACGINYIGIHEKHKYSRNDIKFGSMQKLTERYMWEKLIDSIRTVGK